MVHHNIISKSILSTDMKHVDVKEVDIGNQFTNEQEFGFCEHMFQWIRSEAFKLGFGIVIRRCNNGLDRRRAFVTMTCEMQQILELLDDNNYISRYRMCEDGVIVWDIF